MRRSLLLCSLALAALAAACADSPTAPAQKLRSAIVPGQASHDIIDCRSGYMSSDGRFICTDSL